MTVYEPISPSRQFICSILSNASLEIYPRNHSEILGYQVTPKNMLPSITENNAEKQIFYCKHCKTKKFEVDDSYFDTYNRVGCPVYISL